MDNLLEKIQNRLRSQEEQEQQIIKSKDIDKPTRTKIEIKFTEEEKEIIKSLARLNHMNTSEFIRYVILTKYSNELLK